MLIEKFTALTIPFKDDSVEIPPDLMNMFFFIIFILIIILILIAIFLVLILLWIKRQGKMHYPVKPKIIMRKERNIIQTKKDSVPSGNPIAKASLSNNPTVDKTQTKPTVGIKNVNLPTAKPVQNVSKSPKMTAVRPIRISSHHLSGATPDSETDKDDEEKKKVVSKSDEGNSKY